LTYASKSFKLHLGFDLKELEKFMVRYIFKMGIHDITGHKCKCSRRSAEISAATLYP